VLTGKFSVIEELISRCRAQPTCLSTYSVTIPIMYASFPLSR